MLLRKDVYPYEYMDSWQKFNETKITNKKACYCKLYPEGITDEDFIIAQKLFEKFKLKTYVNIMIYMFKVIHYHLDEFEHFKDKCIEIYELDPAHFYLHLD